jgi:hypothetical protein
MAYLLFKHLRRKYKERHAATATTDESHLVPEVATRQEHESTAKDEGVERENSGVEIPARTQTTLNAEENARIKAETAKRRAYRWKMIIGLLLPNFLAAVDVTIVAPAVPTISSHFSMFVHIMRR